MSRANLAMLLVGALSLCAACTTKKVAAPVEDEPVCADFEVGASHAKMKGGLRKPVRVTILEDDDPISSRILLGKRTAEDPAPMLSVPDDDDVLVVEWAQCENERAPRPVRKDARADSDVASYECGEAKVYAKTELKVVEGDAASRVVRFAAPPEPACWASDGPDGAASPPATAEPTTSASATAEPTASATASASGPAASASAEPAESARPTAATATAAAKAPKSSK